MSTMEMFVLAQSNSGNAAVAGIAAGIGLMMMLVGLAMLVVLFASFWKLFTKAGRPGWEGIIPFYNLFILITKVAIRPWWLFLAIFAAFIPVVGGLVLLAVSILISIDVAKNFGKEIPFAIGLALLPVVFYPILAFSSAKFEPKPKEILPQLV